MVDNPTTAAMVKMAELIFQATQDALETAKHKFVQGIRDQQEEDGKEEDG